MATEVKIKVTAEDASQRVLAGVENGLEDVETASDKAGNGLKDIDRQLSKLDAQVMASRLELKRLAYEFSNVDDEASKIDISKTMQRVQREITQSVKAQKALKFSGLLPDEPDPPAIGKFTRLLGMVSSGAAANVGPVLGSSIGLAAAPLLASTLAGGIIGGVGLGGIVGGVVVASKDPRVKGEFTALKNSLEDQLKEGAGAFVEPTIEGVNIVRESLQSIDVGKIFADTSRYVVPLARGVGGAIEELGNGIEDLAANAGPPIDSIANGIETIGRSVGEGLSSLADNGESAAQSLDTVFTSLGHVTDATFGLVNGIIEAKEFMDDFANGAGAFDAGLKILNRTFDDGSGQLGHYRAGADDAAGGVDRLGEASAETTVTSEKLAAALKEVDEALQREVDPVFKLLDAQKELKEAQEAVTKATEKHGKKSVEAQEALRNLAGKALDLDSAVKALGGTFDGSMTPALRQTLRAAGLTESQLRGLEKQFNSARRSGERFNRNYVAKLRVDGYPTVYRQLYTVQDVLNQIPRAVNIAMRITGVSSASAAAAAIRKNGGYAHGGIVGAAANGATSSGLTLVGEHGPELARLEPGGRVWSNPDTERMLAAGSHRRGAINGQAPNSELMVRAAPGSSYELMDVIVRNLRISINNQAGGDVQRFLGQGG